MQNQNTTSRRRALQIGSLSAIGAGFMAVVAPTASAAVQAEPAAFDLVAALCVEETPESDAQFAEWLAEWREERAIASKRHAAIEAQLEAYVPADRRFELIGKLSDISHDRAQLEMSLHREIMFRHLPGLAPVLHLLWMHALQTKLDALDACGHGYCTDGDNGPY